MSSRLDQMETRRRLEAIERHVDEQVTGISRSIQALENGNATMAMVSALTSRIEAVEARLKSEAPKPPKSSPVVCAPSVAPAYGCMDCGSVVYTATRPAQCCYPAAMARVNVTLAE